MKKLICLILSLVTALSLVGCGGENKRRLPGWDDSKTNIVYYTWGTAQELEIMQEMIDAFNLEYEDYNVMIQQAGNDYYGDLEYQIAGSMSPDIVQMKPGYIQSYVRSGAITSLQNFIDTSEVIDEESMIWDVNDGYRYDRETKTLGAGEIYSLIKDFSPDFVLAYDKNDVDQNVSKLTALDYPKEEGTQYPSKTVPMTWTQFRQFAQALQTTSRMGTHLDNEPLQQLLQWIQQSGASLYTEDDKQVVDIANTEKVKQAFDYYRILRDECTGNTPIAKNSSVQVGGGQMKANQCSSIFIGRWASVSFEWDKETSLNVAYAPTPVPDNYTFTDNSLNNGITAMVGMSISSRSENKEAAWKFIEYYYTHMQELAELGYNIPGNKAIAQEYFLGTAEDSQLTENIKEVNKQYYGYADQHSFVISFNRYLSQASVEQIMSTKLSAYFANSKDKAYSAANWKKTLDEITESLQSALTKAVNRYS